MLKTSITLLGMKTWTFLWSQNKPIDNIVSDRIYFGHKEHCFCLPFQSSMKFNGCILRYNKTEGRCSTTIYVSLCCLPCTPWISCWQHIVQVLVAVSLWKSLMACGSRWNHRDHAELRERPLPLQRWLCLLDPEPIASYRWFRVNIGRESRT